MKLLSQCIGNKLLWDLKGRHGIVTGILEIQHGEYKLIDQYIYNLGSIDGPFDKTHFVNDNNEIVRRVYSPCGSNICSAASTDLCLNDCWRKNRNKNEIF